MFRVYAHLYRIHFKTVQVPTSSPQEAGGEALLNSDFKHFLFFAQEFNLLKDAELAPLRV